MGLARNHAAYFGTSSALAHCHPDCWDRLDKLAYSPLVYSGKFPSKYVFFVLFDYRAGFKLLAVRTIRSHWCGAAVYAPARMDKHLTGCCQHHPWIPVLRKPCRIDCDCHCRKPFRSAPKGFPTYCKITSRPLLNIPIQARIVTIELYKSSSAHFTRRSFFLSSDSQNRRFLTGGAPDP